MKQNDGFYVTYGKRILDIIISLVVICLFWWIYLVIAIFVKINLGSPVIYKTMRAGKVDIATGQEKIFELYKFRSMTNAVDKNGVLLPDVDRLTRFGRILRSTSLDELPEILNIIKGEMSIIGPRPLPVTYLEYYSKEERNRHNVRPGLSGYAQVNGRNSLSWDEKFKLDIYYVKNVSFFMDIKIVFNTIIKIIKRDGIGQGEEMPISLYDERPKN